VDGIVEEGKKKPKKNIDITLWGIWGRGNPGRIDPEVFTSTGLPAVSTPVLRSLAGKPGAARKALAELDMTDSASPTSSCGTWFESHNHCKISFSLYFPTGAPPFS
jgi:DNA polymerase I